VPRYYFNLTNGVPVVDGQGVELPDAAAARREATKYAADLLSRRSGSIRKNAVNDIVVTDERGKEVLTVTFPASAAIG
jgi:uncharacterized protein DUF6894